MIDYKLTDEELAEIQRAMRYSPKVEVRQRATAIHLLHQGNKPEEVAEMMAVSMGSIYGWQRRWREAGVPGLANKAKSGRPKKADQAYCELLDEVIAKQPSDYGYAFGNWSVDRLREHMRQQTGIDLSNRRFRDLLAELGFVYRRPKHDLTQLQDADEKARTTELLDWLKKDASWMTSHSSLWMKQP